jgi:hypothetical protein
MRHRGRGGRLSDRAARRETPEKILKRSLPLDHFLGGHGHYGEMGRSSKRDIGSRCARPFTTLSVCLSLKCGIDFSDWFVAAENILHWYFLLLKLR